MYKIAVFNQKGGVGKTSITTNLSADLYKNLHQRILVVDCDAQKNTQLQLLSFGYESIDHSFIDYANHDCTLSDCTYPVYFNKGRNGKVNLEKSTVDLIPTDARIDTTDFEDIHFLKNAVNSLADHYDYCLFDCSPQKTSGVLLALAAADFVLVPMDAGDVDSVQGWQMVLSLVNELKENHINATLRVLGVIVNKFSRVRAIHNYTLGIFKETFGDVLFQTTIRDSADIEQAKFFRQPICYYKPSSPVARDYNSFAIELNERTKQLSKKAGR